MKCRFTALMLAMGAVGSFTAGEFTFAQSGQSSDAPQGEVVLANLSRPRYPPLARQARIQGDVEVTVRVRLDGSVEAAAIASGHPMLKQAALESAQNSQYECRRCSEAGMSYSMVYTFRIATEYSNQPQTTSVTQSQNHVTVVAEPPVVILDDFGYVRVRSAKCLYLWRCGLR
jgi:TonB family protein